MSEIRPVLGDDDPSWMVDPKVLADAATLGITQEHLLYMVQHSTRITHPKGNRRFHGYLFRVDGNNVSGFCRLDGVPLSTPVKNTIRVKNDCDKCHGTRKVKVFDVCPKCDGVGCSYCEKGFIPTAIPCPACAQRDKLSKT